MRRFVLLIACALVAVSLRTTRAQTPARRPPGVQSSTAADRLPVRRVVLYKNGVGYFEHVGRIRGSQNVTIDFNSSQLNDVLKTLTVLDLGSGRVTGVSYTSEAPLARRLGSLRLSLGEHATRAQLLDALRGTRLQVRAGGRLFNGRLLGVEPRTRTRGNETTTTDELTLVADDGELRVVEITPAVDVRLVQRESAEQVDAFLSLLASSRAQDRRRMTIATAGTGERDLLVGYISEVPIWKTTYRIVLPPRPGPAILQGWAIVDNTIGEDWRNVQLSLVAGAPQSFIEPISQPLYVQRPVVNPPKSMLLTPQTHAATLERAGAAIHGRATDGSGAALPGVTVKAYDEDGAPVAQGVTDSNGAYALDGLPAGAYALSFELTGFQTARIGDFEVEAGDVATQNAVLSVGSLAESVTVAGQRPKSLRAEAGLAGGVVGGVTGGIVGGLAQAPSPGAIQDRLAQVQATATGADLGDLFAYTIDRPVTIEKNQSALVPILRSDVKVDRVSLWTGKAAGSRPLRSVWLTNSSGLTLDGGSFTVLDQGAFAGEGLIEPIKPNEKRLLSYAADLGVQVEPRDQNRPSAVTRISIARGVLVQHRENVSNRVYTIRNSDTTERRIIIEHPIRPGWTLAATNSVKPEETSAAAYRFVVNVPPAKTETLTIVEQQPLDSTFRISDITDQQVELFVRESGNDDGLRAALAPIVAAKAALAAIMADLNAKSAETKRIADDQQRIRENMKALKGSSEEQQLVRRYTTQLAQQEDRVEALRKESDAAERRRQDAQETLRRQIENLSADIAVKPGTR